MNELNTLSTEFPLSTRWRKPELYTDAVTLGEDKLQLAGLATGDAAGNQIVGSAGGMGQLPLARAYFELLERTSVVEAEEKQESWQLKDFSGNPVSALSHDEVFPRSPSPDRWRYARSNGVAAGSSWEGACLAASRELIERDRLLKSWQGQGKPVRVPLGVSLIPEALFAHYEMAVYLYPGKAMVVAACFAFPKNKSKLLIRGFGAREETEAAIEAAVRECLQSMGFLWTETTSETDPPFSPTPDYHQEYYLNPLREKGLRAWLSGDHREEPEISFRAGEISGFVDLTPPALKPCLSIVKALGSGLLPLIFGDAPEWIYTGVSRTGLHPIS